MKPGDLIELEITDLAFGGDGVARHDGRVVFVPFTANGDRLRARVIKTAEKFARAELSELLQPGPGRCQPPCPHFGNCGGCQYQHLDYATQLAIKSKQLRDVLIRIGGITEPAITSWLASPQPYGYRNRISVHQEGRNIGFRARDGRQLIDIRECPIASPEVNAKLRHLREHPGQREHYSLRENGIPELGFYQTNRFLLDDFKQLVAKHCQSQSGDWLIECYGGAGFFTSSLASGERRVTMIESDDRLVTEARTQLHANTEILSGECETIFPELMERPDFTNATILIDPPREGLSAAMRNLLANSQARHLVYVSCNPSTLARDLKELRPRWTPTQFHPIDLFPQTAHFECVAVCDINPQ